MSEGWLVLVGSIFLPGRTGALPFPLLTVLEKPVTVSDGQVIAWDLEGPATAQDELVATVERAATALDGPEAGKTAVGELGTWKEDQGIVSSTFISSIGGGNGW